MFLPPENGSGSKHNAGDHAVVGEGNGERRHSRTESGASPRDETESTHSELPLRSSSSSSSSSSTPLKGLQEADSSKDPNSRPDEPDVSPTDSPPVQVMDRNAPEGYDPSRIPASVFDRSKSNLPAEWSCASNESLFSIHLGNNSFSVYGDLMKSGELFKSGELVPYSPALSLTPPTKIEPKKKTLSTAKKEVETPKEVKKESKEKTADHPAVSWRSPTTSYRSNRSSNSTHSFSFPILAEGVKSEAADAEDDDLKKQKVNASMETTPNQARSRWLCCLPPCPWCCSSHASCSCS
ncbi:PREDICTED: putative protein TPRXL isoform X2 [Tarenaya hassleriana]|uniref:putative protein TPRXL isoform X2 n=1 Tax=Tarenaya hassleriana TaxID=28532 RepID=UPI00053C6CAE|nr:PREDICTED: putative protein TPRXL isoform X2 [Tarenaya hassleriana]